MRTRRGWPSAAWLVILFGFGAGGACGSEEQESGPGALTDVCDDTNNCVCPNNEFCEITCEATGDCNAQCGAGSTCGVDCAGTGACDVDCHAATSCAVDCAGVSNCDVTCPIGGCTVENCGTGCTVTCGVSAAPTIDGTTAKCP